MDVMSRRTLAVAPFMSSEARPYSRNLNCVETKKIVPFISDIPPEMILLVTPMMKFVGQSDLWLGLPLEKTVETPL